MEGSGSIRPIGWSTGELEYWILVYSVGFAYFDTPILRPSIH